MSRRLPQYVIDTGGQGISYWNLLVSLDMISNEDAVKKNIRAGNHYLNRLRVRDTKYQVTPGTYILSFKKKNILEVTVL